MKKVIPVFILISIFVCSFAVVNAEVVEYAQDFESYSTGEVPSEFNRIFAVGVMAVGHVMPSGPTNNIFEYLCMSDDGSPAGLIDMVPVTLTDPVFYIKMQISVDFDPSAFDGTTNIDFSTADGYALSVGFKGSDSMMYVAVGDSGSYVPVLPFKFGTIYEMLIEVDLTTHTYSVFLDNVPVIGAQNIGMKITSTVDNALAFTTNANTGSNGTQMQIDNILIVSEGDPIDDPEDDPVVNPRTGDSGFDIMPVLIALITLAGGIIFKRFAYSR